MPRPMRPFKHFCKPCDRCGSARTVPACTIDREACPTMGEDCDCPQIECPTCEGQSTECTCEAEYDAEGDRRYKYERENG